MKRVPNLKIVIVVALMISAFMANAQLVAPITTAGNINACAGTPCVSVPVTVNGFTNITSFSLRMEFSNANMTFCSFANIHPSISSLTYGTPIHVTGNIYRLMATWAELSPRTLPQGSKLFDVKFNMVSGMGTLSFNNLSNGGSDCEFTVGVGSALTDSPSATYYKNSTITVNPIPVPLINGPATVCINSSNKIYTTDPGMTGYNWTITGGVLVSGAGTNQISVNWMTLGNQSVGISYTTPSGCVPENPTIYQVSVVPQPIPTISGPSSVCANSSGHIYSTQTGMSNYYWTITGGTINSGTGTNSISVTWTSAGTQSLKVNYANAGGCTAATPTQKFITVKAAPVPVITGSSSVCKDVNTNYSTTPWQTNYTWTISPTGVIISGQGTRAVTVKWTSIGAHWIGLNYTNIGGCTAPSPTIKTVTVGLCGSDQLENESGIIGVESTRVKEPILSIYPNPNDGTFTTQFVNFKDGIYLLEVYNMLGVRIFEQKNIHIMGSYTSTFNLGYATPGAYHLFFINNENSFRKLLIIK